MARRVAFFLGGMATGGLERVVFILATTLKARGFDPLVLCYDNRGGSAADELERAGIPIEVMVRRSGIDVSYIARLKRWLFRTKPQVLHVHNETAMFYAGMAAPASPVETVIATQHDGVFPHSRRVQLLNRFLVAGPITHTVAVSESVRRIWSEEDGIPARRITVIPNGVPDPALPRQEHRGIRIGAVGRLFEEKGHELLIRAIAPLLGRRADVELVIVGDGPSRGRLEATRVELGLEGRVTLAGNRSDVPAVLAGLDIFVQPSLREGLPLSILEAMAANLPVIASEVGGIPEAVHHEKNGLLVPAGDEAALAHAIQRLVEDEGLRLRLGSTARNDFLEGYEASRMVDRYEALMR